MDESSGGSDTDVENERFLSSSAAKVLRDNRNAKRLAEGIDRQCVVIANNHTSLPHECLSSDNDHHRNQHVVCDIDIDTNGHRPTDNGGHSYIHANNIAVKADDNEADEDTAHEPPTYIKKEVCEEDNVGRTAITCDNDTQDTHSDETENELNSLTTRLCSFSTDGEETYNMDEDTFESRIDLEKINSIKSKHSMDKRDRKESFEQRLKRTFTIKDAHTNEVTKRIFAIVIKYSLFVFNFLSWVMATAAIVSGVWMSIDKTVVMTTSDTDFFLDPPLMMCIGGGITFIVAFLGCVGALRENLIILKVFFYVLTIILLGEVAIACGVFVIYVVPEARENFLRSKPEQILRSAIQKYMDDPEIKIWLDRIQSEFKCCGISHTDEGFRDWKESAYFNCTPSNKSIYRCAVPKSCCIFGKYDRVNTMCGFEMTDKPLIQVRDYIYTRGCIQGFGEWLGKYDDLIIISCLTILIMQTLAVLSAKLMVIRIRKQRFRWRVLQRSSTASTSSATAARSTC